MDPAKMTEKELQTILLSEKKESILKKNDGQFKVYIAQLQLISATRDHQLKVRV